MYVFFNFQELGYSDPKRWAFLIQSYIQLTFLQQQHNLPPKFDNKLVERSIYSARYCFVENLHRSGSMSGAELAVLDSWFDWITKYLLDPIDLIGRSGPSIMFYYISLNKFYLSEIKLPIQSNLLIPGDTFRKYAGRDWCRVEKQRKAWANLGEAYALRGLVQ